MHQSPRHCELVVASASGEQSVTEEQVRKQQAQLLETSDIDQSPCTLHSTEGLEASNPNSYPCGLCRGLCK